MFWVIEAINEASPKSSITNLSHTLYVVAGAKALALCKSTLHFPQTPEG